MSKTWRFFFVCIILSNILLCIYGEQTPEVQTKLGKIVGTVMKTRLGKNIYAFRSIRYAKPPVGQGRFLPPEPVDPWNNTYDATQEGPECIALGVNGTEDCLVLNVYTSELPSQDSSAKKPVIIYIHGGSFNSLSGKSSSVGPQYLLDKNVVFVTMNYRLGPLGFVSTGDKHAPGNLGLKDQNLALCFVREHIGAFGGDRNSVTLTGESAGSRSVYLHIVSPMSKGLFDRAIALSAPAESLEPYNRDRRDLAIKLGNLLNCTTDNTETMFACLREVPAELFGSIQNQFLESRDESWNPEVEPEISGSERFLTGQPNDLIKSGNFYQVPLITGVTRDEMGAYNIKAVEAAQSGNNSILHNLNKNWEEIAPIDFRYQRGTEKSKIISEELKRFYFNNQPISLKNAIRRAYIFADAITIYPVRKTAKFIAGVSKQPVYFSFFNYEGPYSYYKWSDGRPYGVSHADDLFYIFYASSMPMIKTTNKENQMVERMSSIWENFAQTSKPIPDNNTLFDGVAWERFDPKTINYLELNNNFQIKQNFFADRMQFWEKLYPA